jgi:diamine N-acetyltransferase
MKTHLYRGLDSEQHELSLSSADMAHRIIQHGAKDKPVGYVILSGLAQPHQSIEFRRIVVTDKGKGHGREALRLIKKMAFNELGAHRLWLDVKDGNLHVLRLATNLNRWWFCPCYKVNIKNM